MIRQQLGPNEAPITLSNFPRLGAPGIFTYPPFSVVENGMDGSLTVPEKLTGSHSRYKWVATVTSLVLCSVETGQ